MTVPWFEFDPDACKVGWGPLAHGPSGCRVGHYCGRSVGHHGRHVCEMCSSWVTDEEADLMVGKTITSVNRITNDEVQIVVDSGAVIVMSVWDGDLEFRFEEAE